MGSSKAERLLNLVMLLLNTRRPLSASEIRERIPAYQRWKDSTFQRMFERDKTELRDLGLPLSQDEAIDGAVGYLISEREALLDDPGLTPDEQAALSLAAQAWGTDAMLGVLKLSAASGDDAGGPGGWILPRVGMDKLGARVLEAIASRKRISFRYRSASGEAKQRTVEPHGLVHRGGWWYVVGRDVDAEGTRNFKLSRIEGALEVATGAEPDFEPPPAVEIEQPRAPWEAEPEAVARVAFTEDAAWAAERRAGAHAEGEPEDGWVTLTIPFGDLPSFASWLAGFGGRARVLEPPDLRAAVIDLLRALAEGNA